MGGQKNRNRVKLTGQRSRAASGQTGLGKRVGGSAREIWKTVEAQMRVCA